MIGRRTVSNLYWGLEYDLLSYFGVLRNFSLGDEQATIDALVRAKMVIVDEGLLYKLTPEGQDKKQELSNSLGATKELTTVVKYDIVRFSRRFIFAAQVISEYSYANSQYYPQTIGFFDDQLIKRWFIQNKERQLPQYFHDLLENFLTSLNSDLLANIFVQSLSGHKFSGETEEQIATETGLDPTIVQLQWLKLYAKLFLQLHDDRLTPLKLLLSDLERPVMSKSAQQTFDLFISQNKFNPAKIAQVRGIKLTTVLEHLLEAAIIQPRGQFPFDRLLTSSLKTKLRDNQSKVDGEWQFQDAKAHIPELQFFQFRLFQILERKLGQND
ncbi:hypothetical protein FC98_GL000093 [Lentilactobacillus kisonensis DSM 19906 = JCM 15041]|uniref:Helicase Helix-turn-helix domain-containing protein n=1 Tax=Lentilactobacillus kisonensis DSM 19906 = JCM 15041 TaxID=1423766 RepID=A0A0R1P4G6_9LACO|nr:hypothetical protein FC98_GL000093 [Lentilactobacillus kisonensis DSM 19906 = JCM 15041]